MSSPSRLRSAGPTATVLALTASAVLLVHLVQAQTGTTGLLVGLGLAVLPLPFVLTALTWLNQSARVPNRRLVLCLVWGSCAATTVAMLANGWASDTLTALQGSSRGETLGAEFASPLIEESAKGAVLLLTMAPPLRPRRRTSPAGRPAGTGPTAAARARLRHRAVATGLVLGGFSACGFAFTENVLYLGRAFTDDQRQRLDAIGLGLSPSLRDYDDTVHTFVLRALLAPFAHPLFTALTGVGLAVALTSHRRWLARTAGPLGLLAAVALHGGWNAAAGLGTHGFLLVYAALMVPCFAALTGLALWAAARPGRRLR
ncbi:PrsW family intramembrane metalloprotease [Kitasatospora sp. GAS204B]|uniref:PrsW family intramembrane metalloprotease n=1 Tax=unclassified Kitasatospora TaxID=2633591 RepID=UPI002475AD25|nr:PrsW family intramembrane metalloprotease [Kitasatospora sp. GAS204B]MDH6122066.1 RsiW-degrading membrane proteinase PrsW (M82 family) [Kitasatospora sp. GAS204B]